MNQRIQVKYVLKRKVKIFLSKALLTIILFLIGLIGIKKFPNQKEFLKHFIYEKNIPFLEVKEYYEKTFGKLLSFDKLEKTEAVFSEKLTYQSKETYQNGVKLKVSNHYMVPVLESGIIIYIGEKKDLGNTIIIEQVNGIDVYYSNVLLKNKKLYDYLEKGELLGEVEEDELYLAFQRKGEFLDYQNYL